MLNIEQKAGVKASRLRADVSFRECIDRVKRESRMGFSFRECIDRVKCESRS